MISGCASKPPEAWLLYARVNYLYGRIEAKAEDACAKPGERFASVCAEGAAVQKEVRVIKPVVEAELSKKDPDWNVILGYADKVIGRAGKFLLVP